MCTPDSRNWRLRILIFLLASACWPQPLCPLRWSSRRCGRWWSSGMKSWPRKWSPERRRREGEGEGEGERKLCQGLVQNFSDEQHRWSSLNCKLTKTIDWSLWLRDERALGLKTTNLWHYGVLVNESFLIYARAKMPTLLSKVGEYLGIEDAEILPLRHQQSLRILGLVMAKSFYQPLTDVVKWSEEKKQWEAFLQHK